VTLIVISFCSTTRVQNFDGLIDKLIELNQAAGKDSNDIGIELSSIEQNHNDIKSAELAYAEGASSRCSAAKLLQESLIKNLNADKLAITTRSHKAEEDNKLIDEQVAKLTGQIKVEREGLHALEKSIDDEIENIRVYGSEAEHKLVVVKALRDIITDELLAAPHQQQQHSFIQLAEFNDKIHELKALLQNSNDGIYSPLVSTLLSLAEERGFSDQKILEQILTLLNKLEKNLTEFRHKQKTEGKQNIKNLKEQAKQKLNQIKAIGNLLATNVSNKKDNTNIIESGVKDASSLDHEVARKSKEADQWRKLCDHQDQLKARFQGFSDAFASKIKQAKTQYLDFK